MRGGAGGPVRGYVPGGRPVARGAVAAASPVRPVGMERVVGGRAARKRVRLERGKSGVGSNLRRWADGARRREGGVGVVVEEGARGWRGAADGCCRGRHAAGRYRVEIVVGVVLRRRVRSLEHC